MRPGAFSYSLKVQRSVKPESLRPVLDCIITAEYY